MAIVPILKSGNSLHQLDGISFLLGIVLISVSPFVNWLLMLLAHIPVGVFLTDL